MYILSFLLMLVPLVVIHEFGHFLVCKLGGIRVSNFAFGFGPQIIGFKYGETNYRWNLIPLGGYVDFMGEAVYTNEIPDDARHFYRRPKWLRFLVLLMGPLFNLALALLILFGIYATQPVQEAIYAADPITIGQIVEESPEYKAGLRSQDRILSYNDREAESFDKLRNYIMLNPEQEIQLQIERDGQAQTITYTVAQDPDDGIGLCYFVPLLNMQITGVQEDGPAAKAQLQSGDLLLAVNGTRIYHHNGLDILADQMKQRFPETSTFEIERDGQKQQLEILPTHNQEADRLLIGIFLGFQHRELKPTFERAVDNAISEFINASTMIYSVVLKLISAQISPKVLSGPIHVAQVAKEQLDRGLIDFLFMMAIISINLGILNLLPIPVLDGGEIFVILIEAITRREFSLETKMKIKLIGFVALLGIMSMVIVNDVLRIVT